MTWDDINIEQFAQIQAVYNMDCSDVEKSIRIIAICHMEEYSDVCDLRLNGKVWKALKRQTRFLSELPPTPNFTSLDHKVKVNGKTYTLQLDATKLTAGQYIDIQNFLKGGSVFENMDKVLAVLTGEDVLATAKIFREHFNMTQAYPISVFFWKVYNALTEDMLTSLMEKLGANQSELKHQLKELIENGGDGLSPSTISQIQTYLNDPTFLDSELSSS